ncbi:TolC family protein [Hyunsoonleella flava]|uniref:TolC family protein n=1 Tax=Hyunsoonleella flava TaxID=2527939 RepID=A0A4Q9FIQ3_9FLAO|nr:TolC family protein [Hyunsoonleella flava]TBN02747.1 TolC family protein [Hyunsoonleella flava]
MNRRFCTIVSFIITGFGIYAQELITVEKAVELALEHNYGIKVANSLVEVAENNTSILNSDYLPTVTGNAGATYNLDNTEAVFANGEVTNLNNAESSRYNASVNLNYVLFDGLGRRYNYKSLKEQYQLTELEARETIETTLLQLFSVYYSVAQLYENKKVLTQTLNISNDRLKRSKYQFEYGQVTKLDVLNAEVDINNDSINLINISQELNNAKRDLNLVLGNSVLKVFDVETEVNFAMLFNKEELLQKAIAQNVILQQADKNILINQYELKTGKSEYLPTIGLTGSYGWNENNNNAAAFLAVLTNTGFSGGVNLTWNLFDGGRTLTRVKNARVNLQIQEIQKEQLLATVKRDFENAWDDYQNKLTVFKIQEENIITSQNNFDRTSEKFKLGQVNSIEFRQAQLNFINAELSRNQAKYQAKIAELEVLRLSGELLNTQI